MYHPAHVLPLPGLIERPLDAMAKSLLQPAAGFQVDFSQPKGEAALVPADSVSWRVFKNPVTLFIGGVTAVVLELAEPRVRDGVWQHSSFRQDAVKRLQRTGLAAMVTVYGPRSTAEAMIEGVVRRHGRVTGHTTEGEAYQANDVELLDWVQATAGFGFMEAYAAFARTLSGPERDALYAEAAPTARLYGAVGAPASEAELNALFDSMKARLVASPIVFEFLDIMQTVPALPGPSRAPQRLLVRAAIDILPGWVRERVGLGAEWNLSTLDRLAVKAMAKASDRLLLPSSPAVQSCRRLGLPDDYLYRRLPQ